MSNTDPTYTDQPNRPKSSDDWGKRLLVAIGLFFVTGFIVKILGSALILGMNIPPSTSATGFVISRDNYIHNCLTGVDADTIAKIGNDKANAYCGCVYDEGIAQWGGTEFMNKSEAAEKSNDFTEWNGIVNDCVAKEVR